MRTTTHGSSTFRRILVVVGLGLCAVCVSAQEPTDAAMRWKVRIKKGDTFLVGADLRALDLQDIGMRGARLLAANFDGANLLGVDFTEADLRGAKGLTLEQLQTVKTLYGAQLDPFYKIELEECCGWLFAPPGEQ